MLHLRRQGLPGEGAREKDIIWPGHPKLIPAALKSTKFVRKNLPGSCHTSLDNWTPLLEFLWISWVIACRSIHPFCLKLLKCLNPLEIHTSPLHCSRTASEAGGSRQEDGRTVQTKKWVSSSSLSQIWSRKKIPIRNEFKAYTELQRTTGLCKNICGTCTAKKVLFFWRGWRLYKRWTPFSPSRDAVVGAWTRCGCFILTCCPCKCLSCCSLSCSGMDLLQAEGWGTSCLWAVPARQFLFGDSHHTWISPCCGLTPCCGDKVEFPWFFQGSSCGMIPGQLGPSLLRLSPPFSLSCWLQCSSAGKEFIPRRWERQAGISAESTQGLSGMQTACIPHSPILCSQPGPTEQPGCHILSYEPPEDPSSTPQELQGVGR